MFSDENAAPQLQVKGQKGPAGKSIEETYQKKTQLEHILLRPDTYIGSVEPQTQPCWILETSTGNIINKTVTFVPGLYKIFDEIVVNAADNKQRDPSMNKLDITIDPDENLIRVLNNGKGIPVVIHKEHDMYVPELIFGNLLTGSNFDDNQEKTTGGRNGYGAKLANIFSTEFIVETADSSVGLKFKQVFSKNMGTRTKPEVTKYSGADFTCISFKPDLARFKMQFMDDDTVGLLSKRAYDFAGTSCWSGPKLNVFLNGKKIECKNFEQYMTLYRGLEPACTFERVNERWEVGLGVSDGTFQQVSFVNSICTMKGGVHVNYIADQVAQRLMATIKKKNKGTEVKPSQIKNHLAVYVNCLVSNPAFDSQTKENLTTKVSALGSTCVLTEKMFKLIEKSDIVDHILNWAKFKQNAELKKKSGAKKSKLLGINKLDDANFAGTAKSKDCTLILTEGDSAKALAMSGIGVVGRDYYGAFPLKGKLLNVREAPHQQIMKNDEIQNIAKILGLQFGRTYEDTSSLRYGHLMIMADQDHDGSHIKGLVINFLHFYWPSLLKIEGFMQQFITPIVKCTKGKSEKVFFTIPQYETWREEASASGQWRIKYYKGLGTSTATEAKDYFSNLDVHQVDFHWNGNTDNVLDLAFAKKRVDDRKDWLLAMEHGTFVDYSEKSVAYDTFVNRELILFSHADNARSIPHFMDGMKPSQRKVLFACFKKKLNQELKVAQLAGYIAEKSCYHHGEASLTQTIISMAQNFVGSNNINLLSPCGQFGTRAQGGKDSASPRYVFTKLEPITRCIFHPDDDALLNYLNEDGCMIEPDSYIPIIPMLLVNGSEGIGTGWSTSVPTYNPRDIIANIRRLLNGDDMEEMHPWFRGFYGEIKAKTGKDVGNYSMYGIVEQVDDTNVVISELPIGKWTQDYKQMLETYVIGGPAAGEGAEAAAQTFIKDFKENHTDTTVLFTVSVPQEKMAACLAEKGGLLKKFKLESSISTGNMHAFDLNNQIKKFDSAEQILASFYDVRLEFYEKRKEYLLSQFREEWSRLDNKVRFILAVISGSIVVANRKKDELLQELHRKGFQTFIQQKKTISEDDDGNHAEDEPNGDELNKGYDYLLSMKLWSLTMEKVQSLTAERDQKKSELDILAAKTPADLWSADLDALETTLDDFDAAFEAEAALEQAARRKATKAKGGKPAGGGKAKSKAKAKSHDSDDEDDMSEDDFGGESDSDFEDKPKKKAPAAKKIPAQVISSVEVARPAAKPVVSAAPKATVSLAQAKMSTFVKPSKPAPVVTEIPAVVMKPKEDEEETSGLSLAQRLLNRMKLANEGVSLAPAVAAPAPEPVLAFAEPMANKGVKRAPKQTSKKDSEADHSYSPGTPADKPAKKAVKSTVSHVMSIAVSEPDSPLAKPSKKASAVPKPAASKVAVNKKVAPKKKSSKYDSDEEDEFASDASDDESVGAPVAPRSLPARARKPIVYAAESDEEDFENSFEEESDYESD